MVILMGLPQPPKYQLFLWLTLPMGLPQTPNYQLFLWDCPNLPITSYSYGYFLGIAPASELPTILMVIPMGLPQPLKYQLLLIGWGLGPDLAFRSFPPAFGATCLVCGCH